jgi:hypothetical protein
LSSYLWRVTLALLGVVAFVIIGIAFENKLGLPFDMTYRVACAAVCLLFVFKLGSDYPGERWVWVSFWVVLLLNIGLFFTPLANRPASRGELMLFALPDAVVVLVARIISYPVLDEHQRAMRQQLNLGLAVAFAFCVILFALSLIEPNAARR